MSDPHAETVEPGCAAETRSTVKSAAIVDPGEVTETVQPGKAMEATGPKPETGEPAEGIAVAVIGPVIVTRRALGIVTAARRDTAGAEVWGKGVSGRADRKRSGRGGRRSAQHRRGRGRGCRVRWVRRRYRNDFRADRDGSDQGKDAYEGAELRAACA